KNFHANALNFANDDHDYRTVTIAVALRRTAALVRNLDPRMAGPVAFDQCEQPSGMPPHAAMRRAGGLAGAVLRKSSNCDCRAIAPALEFHATLGARGIQ